MIGELESIGLTEGCGVDGATEGKTDGDCDGVDVFGDSVGWLDDVIGDDDGAPDGLAVGL